MTNAGRRFPQYPPSQRRRVLRPVDFGIGMTVCIASLADSGGAIVFATDQMASLPLFSAEHAMVKGDFLGADWFAMWAGDDITSVPFILERAREELGKLGKSFTWSDGQVASALSEAYQVETRLRAVTEYLSPFGLTMAEFLSNGSHFFQDTYIARLQQIEQFDLGITFLVVGYRGHTPAIFTVERRGSVKRFDKPGFWAIGSGEHLALGALSLRQHNTTRTIQETIYSVLEAKFSAERSPGVGKDTTLGLLNPHTFITLMQVDTINSVRDSWTRQSQAPQPDMMRAVHEWWKPHQQSMEKQKIDNMKETLMRAGAREVKRPIPQRSKRGPKGRPPSKE